MCPRNALCCCCLWRRANISRFSFCPFFTFCFFLVTGHLVYAKSLFCNFANLAFKISLILAGRCAHSQNRPSETPQFFQLFGNPFFKKLKKNTGVSLGCNFQPLKNLRKINVSWLQPWKNLRKINVLWLQPLKNLRKINVLGSVLGPGWGGGGIPKI